MIVLSPVCIVKISASNNRSLFADSESVTTEEVVTLSEVKEEISLTNHLLVGIIFFLGLLFGIIGARLFFSKIKAD